MMRQKKDPFNIDNFIWDKAVPFKMAFMTWRAIHDKVLTNEKLSSWGIDGGTRCYCCSNSEVSETTEHLFCSGDLANAVWQKF